MRLDISNRLALCLIVLAILFNVDSLSVLWFDALSPPTGASSIYWEKQTAGVEACK